MKCIPMIFNSEMVKALVEGRKTEVRIPIPKWQQPKLTHDGDCYMTVASNHRRWGFGLFGNTPDEAMQQFNKGYSSLCPYGTKGDLVWVRETFLTDPSADDDAWDDNDLSYYEWSGCGEDLKDIPDTLKNNDSILYKASCTDFDFKWRPSTNMPRWASRTTLRIKSARVDKVKNITAEDAKKEGFDCRMAFVKHWNKKHKNWRDNPHVWVVEFEVIHQNIDKHINSLSDSIKVPVYVGTESVDDDHYRFIRDSFEFKPIKITRRKRCNSWSLRGYIYDVHFIGREPMIDINKKSLAGCKCVEMICAGINCGWQPPVSGWVNDVWTPEN